MVKMFGEHRFHMMIVLRKLGVIEYERGSTDYDYDEGVFWEIDIK